ARGLPPPATASAPRALGTAAMPPKVAGPPVAATAPGRAAPASRPASLFPATGPAPRTVPAALRRPAPRSGPASAALPRPPRRRGISLLAPICGAAVKRAVDLVVAASGLVLGLPVMLLVAVLVRARMGGPVFFRQS